MDRVFSFIAPPASLRKPLRDTPQEGCLYRACCRASIIQRISRQISSICCQNKKGRIPFKQQTATEKCFQGARCCLNHRQRGFRRAWLLQAGVLGKGGRGVLFRTSIEKALPGPFLVRWGPAEQEPQLSNQGLSV